MQGDVIAITDDAGAVVARYTYDAWGKCTIGSDSSGVGIAAINPFRYRSYYYDTEIELYYLQSRYYNPEIGRFINADEAETILMQEDLLNKNFYIYCSNDPINQVDESGLISLKSIQQTLKKYLGIIVAKFINYLKTLIYIENGKLRISTTLISSTIDSIIFAIGSALAFFGKKFLFKVIKKLLFKNKKTTSEFVKFFIKLLNALSIVKLVIWAIGTCIKAKAIQINGIIKDFVANLVCAEYELLKSINKIYSLTSFSGFIAFIFDLFDGQWDEYVTIPIKIPVVAL